MKIFLTSMAWIYLVNAIFLALFLAEILRRRYKFPSVALPALFVLSTVPLIGVALTFFYLASDSFALFGWL